MRLLRVLVIAAIAGTWGCASVPAEKTAIEIPSAEERAASIEPGESVVISIGGIRRVETGWYELEMVVSGPPGTTGPVAMALWTGLRVHPDSFFDVYRDEAGGHSPLRLVGSEDQGGCYDPPTMKGVELQRDTVSALVFFPVVQGSLGRPGAARIIVPKPAGCWAKSWFGEDREVKFSSDAFKVVIR